RGDRVTMRRTPRCQNSHSVHALVETCGRPASPIDVTSTGTFIARAIALALTLGSACGGAPRAPTAPTAAATTDAQAAPAAKPDEPRAPDPDPHRPPPRKARELHC